MCQLQIMKVKKPALLILLLHLFLQNSQAQNINGDTILVSADNQTWLTFLGQPNGQITKEANNFTVSGTGKSLLIQPLKANTQPTVLMVQEGSRTHQFLIVYKPDVSPLETTYNFSDLKKIEKEIKEKNARRGGVKSVADNSKQKNPPPAANETKSTAAPGVKKETLDFALAISAGDEAFDAERYEEAKQAYQKALGMKGNHDYAKSKLSEIDKKLAEREKLAQKLKDDNYNASILKAAKAFTAKQYEEAKAAYNEALDFRPNDVFATNQVKSLNKTIADEAEKEKQNEALKQQQETYKAAVANADKAFNAEQYEDAKSYYSLAVTLNSSDPYPKKKLQDTEKKLAASSKEKADKEKENAFNSIVIKGNAALEVRDFETARKLYNEALTMKPGDVSVTRQLRAIDKTLNDQAQKEKEEQQSKENENAFNEAMSAADNAFKAEDYTVAKSGYARALKLKSDSRAEEQIKNINTILDKIKEKELGEKERNEKEALKLRNYEIAFKKAENYFSAKDYANAKLSYREALNYKDDQFAKDQIIEIDRLLIEIEAKNKALKEKKAEESELDKKYNAAIEKAKTLMSNEDYSNAKVAYAEALQLKPSELIPKSQMEAIDKKLMDLEANNKYEVAISKANVATGDRNYAEALKYYKEALRIKPLASYPFKQIDYINSVVAKDSLDAQAKRQFAERQVITKAQEEERIRNFNDGMSAYKRGEQAISERRYEDALAEYKDFLRLIPDAKELNNYQYNAQGSIEFAKKKIVDLNNYMLRIKGESYQPDAIPYALEELKSKYPKLNFAVPPSDQEFNPADGVQENMANAKTLLSKPSALNLADSVNNIKITCQAISKKGDFVYLKMRIQNRDTKEFFTGPMQLGLNKKGKVSKQNPTHISAFPIVLPGKEFSVIYATKDFNVNDNENLLFELSDRLKTMNMKVVIPGETFNQEKIK